MSNSGRDSGDPSGRYGGSDGPRGRYGRSGGRGGRYGGYSGPRGRHGGPDGPYGDVGRQHGSRGGYRASTDADAGRGRGGGSFAGSVPGAGETLYPPLSFDALDLSSFPPLGQPARPSGAPPPVVVPRPVVAPRPSPSYPPSSSAALAPPSFRPLGPNARLFVAPPPVVVPGPVVAPSPSPLYPPLSSAALAPSSSRPLGPNARPFVAPPAVMAPRPVVAPRPSPSYPPISSAALAPSSFPPLGQTARPSGAPRAVVAPRPVIPPHPSPSPVSVNPTVSTASSCQGPSSSSRGAVSSMADAVEQPLIPVSSKGIQVPLRPGFGEKGRKIVVKANHFLVKVADRDIHQYKVTITPEVKCKKINRLVIEQLVKLYRGSHMASLLPAYDGGKILYTAGPLPFDLPEFNVTLPNIEGSSSSSRNNDRQFKVAIEFTSKPNMDNLIEFLRSRRTEMPQDALQVLDVVLRMMPSSKYITVGRSFFAKSLGVGVGGSLGNGVEYYPGYFQSLRATQMGLSLNIDVSARSFYEPLDVPDFIVKYLNITNLGGPLSEPDRNRVRRALKSLRVKLQHYDYKRSIRISGLSPRPINQLTFIDADNTTISVTDYFGQKYNFKVRYPHMPALQSGSDSKPAYFPMELCKIAEGQPYTKKLNQGQVRAMLEATSTDPSTRANAIKKTVLGNNYSDDELVRNEFGMDVTNELAVVEARLLDPPTLTYLVRGRPHYVTPRGGKWNMMNQQVINGGKVDHWAFINFSTVHINAASEFCYDLIKKCREIGIEFNPEPVIPMDNGNARNIEKSLTDLAARLPKGTRLQLLIILLPDKDRKPGVDRKPDGDRKYGTIKRVCETELGIVSQCCLPEKAVKGSQQYLANVSLKINVKVGGRNNVLSKRLPGVSDRPTIIFGADVTHPQPGEDSCPSIAAVVASMDWPHVSKYRALVSAQAPRQEIIQNLYEPVTDSAGNIGKGGMIRDHLQSFYRHNHLWPDRLIFFRDGVSESQFIQVLLDEVHSIKKACASIKNCKPPAVTFVVVQKRHHTRLFPADNNADGRGNILPGTVVDTTICHPREFDFYLNSHAGIKGTNRPTHYHVLYDDNNFTADQIQELTNSLCYTYARCNRSVSIVPPAYYAHLAAFRARSYIESSHGESDSASGSGRAGAIWRALPIIKDNVTEVMFYC